jgi:hypothetical protein
MNEDEFKAGMAQCKPATEPRTYKEPGLLKAFEVPARNLICPACGKKTGQQIRYGNYDNYQPEKYIYGGCIVRLAESPEFGCLACEHRWGVLKDPG